MKNKIMFISFEYNSKEEGIAIHIARKGQGYRTYKYSSIRSYMINLRTEGWKVSYYEKELVLSPKKEK